MSYITEQNQPPGWYPESTATAPPIAVEPLRVTQNGTTIAPSGKAYSPVVVNVPNPNSIQNITGTVANPWGDVDYSHFAAALYSGDAHATIGFEFNGMQVMIMLASTGSNVYGSAVNMGEAVADSIAVNLLWDNDDFGAIIRAKAIMGGQLQDLISYTPGLTSYLAIYWHPMP